MMTLCKKTAAGFMALLFVLALASPVLAAEQPASYVFDDAGLFAGGGLDEVKTQAQQVSEMLGADVVVLTTDTDHGATASDYAEFFFDEAEYGSGATRSGLMLYIDMYNREIICLTNGRVDDWLWNHNKDIRDAGVSLLSAGEYTAAMTAMLTTAQRYALQENGYAGLGFFQRIGYKLTWELVGRSLLVGLGLAVIVVGIMLAMHYNGNPKAPHAAVYFGEGGLRTTHAADYFIHTRTTRTAIPKDTSSSSGGSGGGGGGGGGRTVGSSKF